jgi:hypothetical protein
VPAASSPAWPRRRSAGRSLRATSTR